MTGYGPFMRYLPALMNGLQPDSPLAAVVEAVALRCAASLPGCEHYANRASQSYGRALHKAGAAIADAPFVHSDQTLMAVLLLAIYEASVLSHASRPDVS